MTTWLLRQDAQYPEALADSGGMPAWTASDGAMARRQEHNAHHRWPVIVVISVVITMRQGLLFLLHRCRVGLCFWWWWGGRPGCWWGRDWSPVMMIRSMTGVFAAHGEGGQCLMCFG